MAAPRPTGSQDLFDTYFRRADLDGDGRISGAEAVAFFQASNLPKNVLAQVWSYADAKKAGYLGRAEFYNALKLVTVAQSRRELTPEIVKAAIYSPASANIPAPKINLAATPSPQPRGVVPATQAQGATSMPSSVAAGMRGGQMGGTVSTSNQQVVPGQQNQFNGPRPAQPPQNFQSQGMPAGGAGAPRTAPNSVANHIPTPHMTPAVISSTTARPQESAPVHKPQDSSAPSGARALDVPSSQLVGKNPKELAASGNGFASDSLFGDVFAVGSTEPKQPTTGTTSTVAISSVSSGTVVAPRVAQSIVRQSSIPQHGSLGQHPVGVQNQLAGQISQPFAPSGAASGTTGSTVGAGMSASSQMTQRQAQLRPQYQPQPQHQPHSQPYHQPHHQPHHQPQPLPHHQPHHQPRPRPHSHSQAPWPKMTPADVQKYTKVFVQVDTDRDGKITGNQARNLFFSWKLPQEALKQVWDLSDQDNDSMLSLREFCIAVYLMERYREGRPLPPVFPSTIISSESMFTSPGQSVAPHGNASWGHPHGAQHHQLHGGSRPPAIPKGKPPRPVPLSPSDGMVQPTQPKRKMPELEKHLVDQLSKEEQDSLNSKFEEATAIDKKVDELEKEIADSKQKIEFFHAKMQELVLYKSRCDNRYNEITERVSGDKRELESLAKKYEEKYKKSGNVGSKLTIEEATFRDIQEKKMELYQAIVKFEEGKLDDGVVKERTEHIQSGLEELIRNLNERCKQYGVRGKPTTLVELPFGWQPGIQEGSADWDEEWDKLEEEGFVFVKELTLDVQNVIAPPKEKSSAWKKEITASSNEGEDISSSDVESKTEKKPSSDEEASEKDPASADGKNDRNGSLDDPDARKGIEADDSPRTKDTRSENGHDDGESTASAGKTVNYDSHDETDSVSSFNGKDKDHEKHDSGFGFGFGFDDFSIKPIKTGSTLSNDFLPPKLSIFSDSVPSPSANANDGFTAKPSLFADSVPSTPATTTASYSGNKSYFDDSVPSTPAYAGKSFFDDSVPSTPAYPGNMFPEKKSFFDDSVPSTPAYSTSDFGGKPFASETPRSDNLFPGRSPFMFDSVPSTPAAHDDFSSNTFSRFDSFNSNNNDAFSLSRSDSMRSTSEPDPFASRFDSFNYQRYDSFNAQSYDSSSNNYAAETPKASLTRFDSIGSTRDADYSHGFGFDDHDPFGSTGPFKTTTNTAETPRSSDHWNAF
ncbi:epidermal growth factor receptor substrate 15-like 1 [Brassica napus]|uniref:epidermal growth factor receptor substrate 15-like 1 n=1 Tax=Brassica napus TaxID=3708 RepID=UPI0020787B47|nr:epidermal growth factor receptor substrate 15-like 1 [Brassica napus]